MSDKYASVLSKAHSLSIPSIQESKILSNIAQSTMEMVNDYAKNFKQVQETLFAGSYAKGTWLKGSADIDIFIKIDPATPEKEFEQIGIDIGTKSLSKFGSFLRYSDHPYVEAVVRGTRINVVPCYAVESGKWKSAADRSPYHTQYIIENFDDDKRTQVRLLKKFLKATGIYGAEISTNGFSGYVSEVLVLKYGSFISVLQAIAQLDGVNNIISITPYDRDIISTFSSSLIITDPVDTRRNLGTAISSDSVGKFILAARSFLEDPQIDFFVESGAGNNDLYHSSALKKKGKSSGGAGNIHNKKSNSSKKIQLSSKTLYSNILVVEFAHPQKSPDIIWGQIKKSLNSISRQLDITGFKVIRSTCRTDEKKSGVFVFLLESIKLPELVQRKGPSIYMREETSRFIDKNKDFSIIWADSDLRMAAVSRRKHTDAKNYIKTLVVSTNSKSYRSSAITKGVLDNTKRSLQIYTGNERKIKGLARNAVSEIISTNSFIIR